MKLGKADLVAEFDLAADALEGVIILANLGEMERHLQSKVFPALAATVRLVTDRLRLSARALDEE